MALPDATLPTGNGSYTVFSVIKADTIGDRGWLSGGTVGVPDNHNAFRTGGAGQFINYWWADDMSSAAGEAVVNTPYILTFSYNSGGGRALRKQGRLVVADASNSRNGQAGNNRIGYTGNGLEFWDGQVSEIIIYSQGVGTAGRHAIEGYLALKYGTGVKTSANPSIGTGETGCYPLGATGACVNLISFSSAGSLSTQVFTSDAGGSFSGGSATSNDSTSVTPTRYSKDRYWQINQTGLSGLTVSISLDISDITGIVDPDKLVILKRAAGSSNPWMPINTTRIGNTLHAYNQAGFAEIAIGGDTTGLPVSVSEFLVE